MDSYGHATDNFCAYSGVVSKKCQLQQTLMRNSQRLLSINCACHKLHNNLINDLVGSSTSATFLFTCALYNINQSIARKGGGGRGGKMKHFLGRQTALLRPRAPWPGRHITCMRAWCVGEGMMHSACTPSCYTLQRTVGLLYYAVDT